MTLRPLPVSCAAHATTHVYLLLYPAVLYLIEHEFQGIDDSTHGRINTVGFFFGLAALPCGWLVARFGAPAVLAVGFGLAALASALVGLTNDLVQLTWCLLLLNLGLGLYHPAANTLISHYCPLRGRALGIHGTFGSVGEALGPVLGVTLAALLLGWRPVFVAMAIPGILLMTAYARMARTLPAPTVKSDAEERHGAFFNTPLLLVFAVLVLNGCLYRVLILWLPKFMQEYGPASTWLNLGEDYMRGGLFAGLILGVGGIGQWVSGHLSDRHNPALLLVAYYLLSGAALAGMALTGGGSLLLVSLLFGFVYFMVQPVTNMLVARYSTTRLRGWAFGLAFFAQFGPGALVLPWAGQLADQQGLRALFGWSAAWIVLIIMVCLILWRVSRPAAPTR